MTRSKILLVIGTRPEAIKMAPVYHELRRHEHRFETRVCLTGQHADLLRSALEIFCIPIDVQLEAGMQGEGLSGIAGRVLTSFDAALERERPDWVLVQGDTTSAAMAALAAFHRRIRVGHVEAGLRSYDREHPFPEEVNRRLISVVADLHFAPSRGAGVALEREGISPDTIRVTGNTVIDALRHVADLTPGSDGVLPDISEEKRLILVTAHRRESWGEPLRSICRAVRSVAEARRDEVEVLLPYHLNPVVSDIVHGELADVSNVTLVAPLDYSSMVQAMKRAYLIVTDSGGIQEEAPTFGCPVLVTRERTERVEAIEAGTARLVGTSESQIVAEMNRLLDDPRAYSAMATAVNPYGDGHAAERIVSALDSARGV
jgi:UDP-N-acetylglucosamine 2-epimerase (non-hydrolysing)